MQREIAERDQQARRQRQLNVEPVENLHEPRHHEEHEKRDDARAHATHHRRINHRRSELCLHLGELLEMVRHAPQHFHQRTALLAGAHHVDIQIRKNARLPRHRVRQTAALGDFLFQIAAHLGGNALGLQMRHAVKRHRQRHAGVEEVRQLLGERRQFLQPRFAFLLKLRAHRRWQKREQIHFFPVALLAVGRRAAFGGVHRNGEKPEPLDLHQRRRTVGHLQNAFDQFAGAAPGLVGKLRHIPLFKTVAHQKFHMPPRR